MKVGELRIGSLIEFNGRYLSLTSIDSERVFESNKVKLNVAVRLSNQSAPWLNHLKPIILNESFLKDFGFVNIGCSWEKDQVLIFESFDQFDIDFEYRFNRTKVYIKYVHQLQNLYFALTGEELLYNG